MEHPASLAGSWYPSSPSSLREMVDRCLEDGLKRYGDPAVGAEGVPAAVMVPHAGLLYSGAVAAVGYHLLRQAYSSIDTIVVFGPSHRSRLSTPAIWAAGSWDTPLGPIAVDSDLAQIFIEDGVGLEEYRPHHGDNAIEIQTPFIRRLFPEAAILPIAIAPGQSALTTGELSATAAAASGKTVIAVASTDLTHYGASFGVTPAGFGEMALVWSMANDTAYLQAVGEMDAEKSLVLADTAGAACGAGAVAAAIGWAKAFGCRHGRLLCHTTSHHVHPDGPAEHFVGYASMVFEIPT